MAKIHAHALKQIFKFSIFTPLKWLLSREIRYEEFTHQWQGLGTLDHKVQFTRSIY